MNWGWLNGRVTYCSARSKKKDFRGSVVLEMVNKLGSKKNASGYHRFTGDNLASGKRRSSFRFGFIKQLFSNLENNKSEISIAGLK
jgi:hypothetical protein